MKRLLIATAFACLATVATAQQAYRCPDRNGRAYFSNLPCQNGQVPIGSTPADDGGSSRALSVARPARLDELPTAARMETNPSRRMRNVEEASPLMSAYQANVNRRAVEVASRDAGVPTLERQLAEAERADRADHLWTPEIGDSEITKGIRAQLNEARAAASQQWPQLVQLDAPFQATKALWDTLLR